MLLLTETDKETQYFDTTVVGDVLVVVTVLVCIVNLTGMGFVISKHAKKIKADQDIKSGKKTAVMPTTHSGETAPPSKQDQGQECQRKLSTMPNDRSQKTPLPSKVDRGQDSGKEPAVVSADRSWEKLPLFSGPVASSSPAAVSRNDSISKRDSSRADAAKSRAQRKMDLRQTVETSESKFML